MIVSNLRNVTKSLRVPKRDMRNLLQNNEMFENEIKNQQKFNDIH